MAAIHAHSGLPPLLYLEDHGPTRRSVLRLLQGRVAVIMAGTVAEALSRSKEETLLLGAILDERLPDGSGIAAADELRQHHPHLPLLVMTGEVGEDVMHRAQLVGAEFLPKPARPDNLYAFIGRCRAQVDPTKVFCIQHGLSERESELLRGAERGSSVKELAATLGVSISTVKSYASRICAKTGYRNLASVMKAVHSENA